VADHEPLDSDPELPPKTVCGREMTAEISWYPHTLYQGRTIYFCTEFCLEAFKADPDRFFAAHSAKKTP
jgi:YHS domain-containing protein